MSDLDIERLGERYIRKLVAACEKLGISVEGISKEVLEIAIESDDEGPVLVLSLVGTKSWNPFDGSEAEAFEILDREAERMADGLELDWWVAGDGWKQYRP